MGLRAVASGLSSINGVSGSITLTSTGGTISITPNPGTGTIDLETVGGGGTPAGPNKAVQFNNSGVFGGTANLEWDIATNFLGVVGGVQVSGDIQGHTINHDVKSDFSIGYHAIANGGSYASAVVIGNYSQSLSYNDITIGYRSQNNASATVIVGSNATAYYGGTYNNLVMGPNCSVSGSNSVAVGTNAQVIVGSNYSAALGSNSSVHGINSVALGKGATVGFAGSCLRSMALGASTIIRSGDDNTSISTLSQSTGHATTVIGACTKTFGDYGNTSNLSMILHVGKILRDISTTSTFVLTGGPLILDPTTPGTAISAALCTLDLSRGTDAVALPSGTTAQRPTGTNGMIRYNTDLNTIETFGSSVWKTGMYRSAVADTNFSAVNHGLDQIDVVALTSLTATRTITFTPAGTTTNPKQWCVKDESGNCSGTKLITLASTSGTFDGLTTVSISTAAGSKTFYDNGTNFFMA